MKVSKKESKNKKNQKLTGTIADYPLVEVKWSDATGDAGWHDINKAMLSKPARPVSLGYKLLQNRDKIIIFTDYIVDEEYAHDNKLGIWKSEFVEPYTFRRQNKN